MNIYMPEGTQMIIEALENAGYEAYIVGGCVRDALLSKRADDFDITTSAPPDEVKRIFEKTVDTGIAHGTVTVICKDAAYEVTTFRIDGEYLDMRHPSSVLFTSRLEDDLSRRDFTVNAMAYNKKAGLVDAHDGLGDLKKRIIRTVGESEARFEEDALRILRGIRFAAVLGFDIEERTSHAIKKLSPRLSGVSAERIFAEWKKLIRGVDAYKILHEYFDVVSVILPELDRISLPEKVKFDALSPLERQISLFVFCGGASSYERAAEKLKMDSKTRDIGIAVLNKLALLKNSDIREFVISENDEVTLSAVKIGEAFEICECGTYDTVRKMICEDDCIRRVSQLDMGGGELSALGFRGKMIGDMLKLILREVAIGNLENKKEKLLLYSKKALSSYNNTMQIT